jgi:hypothetical protein
MNYALMPRCGHVAVDLKSNFIHIESMLICLLTEANNQNSDQGFTHLVEKSQPISNIIFSRMGGCIRHLYLKFSKGV